MLLKLEKLIAKYGMKITGLAQFGANTGQEVPLFESLGITNLHLIEPCTGAFTELHNKYAGKYYLHNVAVSNFNGEQTMYVTDFNNGQSNSLLKPKLHIEYYPNIEFNTGEIVCVRTIDDLIFTDVNFWMFDIQGGEVSALKGAKDSMWQVEYIYTEININELYEGCGLLDELDSLLKDFVRLETKLKKNGSWGEALYIAKRLL